MIVNFKLKTFSYILIIVAQWFVKRAASGASNLHMVDGTETASVIGDDWFFEIIHPEEIAYTYKIRPARDFGTPFNETWRRVSMVLADPPCLCNFPRNQDDIEGAVVLVERGDCSFLSKSRKAQEAGAIAVLIMDNDRDNDLYYIDMIDDTTQREVHIPAAFMLGKNGFAIKKALQGVDSRKAVINIPVNITNMPLHLLNQPPWLVW